jgi:hypothetical protein
MQTLFDVPEIKITTKKKQREYVNAEMIIRKFKDFKFEFPIELIASSLAGCIERINQNYSPSQIIKIEIDIRKKAKEWYNMPDDAITAFIYLLQKNIRNIELASELRKYYGDNVDRKEVYNYLSVHRKDGKLIGEKLND